MTRIGAVAATAAFLVLSAASAHAEEDVLHRVLRGLNPHAAAVRDLRRATWNYEHCAATKTDCQVEREMMDVYLRALEATPPRQQ
jgi:hypothetical protein